MLALSLQPLSPGPGPHPELSPAQQLDGPDEESAVQWGLRALNLPPKVGSAEMMQCRGERNNTSGLEGHHRLLFPGQGITKKVLKSHAGLKLAHSPPRGLQDVNGDGWGGLQAERRERPHLRAAVAF